MPYICITLVDPTPHSRALPPPSSRHGSTASCSRPCKMGFNDTMFSMIPCFTNRCVRAYPSQCLHTVPYQLRRVLHAGGAVGRCLPASSSGNDTTRHDGGVVVTLILVWIHTRVSPAHPTKIPPPLNPPRWCPFHPIGPCNGVKRITNDNARA
jgi:hypothetical protein